MWAVLMIWIYAEDVHEIRGTTQFKDRITDMNI
jgi:hypothetical protein